MQVKEISPETYQDFIKDIYHNPFQDVQMYRRIEAEGRKPLLLGGYKNDELVIAMLVTDTPYKKIFRYFSNPLGWVQKNLDDTQLTAEFFEAIKDKYKHSNVIALRVEPFIERFEQDRDGNAVEGGWSNQDWVERMRKAGLQIPEPYYHMSTLANPRQVSIIDLASLKNWKGFADETTEKEAMRPEKELLKAMKPNTKRECLRAASPYILVEDVRPEDLEAIGNLSAEVKNFAFPGMEKITAMQKGFGDKCRIKGAWLDTKAYEAEMRKSIASLQKQIDKNAPNPKKAGLVRELQSQLEKEEQRLQQAIELQKDGDKLLMAASMYLYSDYVIFYLFSGIDRKYKEFHGSLRLLYDTMLEGLESGAWQFNLLGIGGDYKNPEMDGYSLFEYKRNLGAHVAEYPGISQYPIRPVLFKLLMSDFKA